MSNILRKTCTTCGVEKPQTTEFFNLLTGGYWRGSCKECRAAVSRKHHADNPQMTEARRASYNARKINAGGMCSALDLKILRERQDDLCAYCGDELKGSGELDHRISLINGGTNNIINLAWSCRTCNRDKGSKNAKEFLIWRKKLGLKINPKILFKNPIR